MAEALKQGTFTRNFGGFGMAEGREYPRFHIELEQDPLKSEQEGRPIFREVEMVEIIFPGNQYFMPDVRVTDEHRRRWPESYKAFKEGLEFKVNGTPLEEWPRLSRRLVMEYKAIGILTVEHIAAMDDLGLQRMGMGARELQAAARTWLEASKGNAPLEAMAIESVRQAETIKEQAAKIDELTQLVKRMERMVDPGEGDSTEPGKRGKKAA